MTMTKADFTLTGIKTLDTDDGVAFNGTLRLKGKAIAECHDDGNGGCILIRYENREIEKQVQDWCKAQPDIITEYDDPDDRSKKMTLDFDDQLLVGGLLDAYLQAQDEKKLQAKLKRISKTKTLYRLKGWEFGEYASVNAVGQRAVDYLVKKYGDQIEEIYGHELPQKAAA